MHRYLPDWHPTLASDESAVIRILSGMAAWPIFSASWPVFSSACVINKIDPTPLSEATAGGASRQRPAPGDLDHCRLSSSSSSWQRTAPWNLLSRRAWGRDLDGVHRSYPPPASADQPLEVQVIAQQWWFTYRYPTFGRSNDPARSPGGTKIEFNVTSLDVVHSFNFYALGVKADAVPLNDNVTSPSPRRSRNISASNARNCAACGTATWQTTRRWCLSSIGFRHVDSAADSAWSAPVMKYLPPYSHT